MTAVNEFFSAIQSNTSIQLGTWAMTSFGILAKSSLLLLCAWTFVALQRRRSAAMRHMTWTLALACSLALLVLPIAMPAWKVLPRIEKTQPAKIVDLRAGENIFAMMAAEPQPKSSHDATRSTATNKAT